MILGIEIIIFCLLLWLICWMPMRNDETRLKGFRSYPDELKNLLKIDEKLKDKIKETNPIIIFISNTILFLIIEFIMGIFLRKSDYLYNFIALLILGQTVNLFDVLVLDFIWFRNYKKVRFDDYPDPKLYKNMKNHLISFAKGIVMFTITAAIDAAFLILF